MSRHQLVQRPDLAGPARRLDIVVGWDGPLQTFFAHVVDLDADEASKDRTLLWLGTRWKGEPSARRVLDALVPWAVRPHDLFGTLMAERDRDVRTDKPVVLKWLEARLGGDGQAE